MAGEFLRQHGIDIDAEMARIQSGGQSHEGLQPVANPWQAELDTRESSLESITNASLPCTPQGTRWDIHFDQGHVTQTMQHDPQHFTSGQGTIDAHGALLAPSLCHPHVHLDKAYLLSHPKYSDLQIERGDFAEAMELTGKAKAQFTASDLLERGQRLIDESVKAGVTHMRAFVEVDAGVGMKCLDAGIQLKRAAEEAGVCHVQLCAFAQLPLFSPSQGDEKGEVIRGLMEEAAGMEEVECVGSTPYVEADRDKMEENVKWMVELSAKHRGHLDFHLDYNLDPSTEPMAWHVISSLKQQDWHQKTGRDRTVVLGHCTRLTLFSDEKWRKLKEEIADLPVSFVGLPTSDLFMMRTPERTRGTLDIPKLIKEYNLNACMGINNIGNAFTPHGSCDPLTLACNGVGVYQAGTKQDAELLYECVSSRARQAIGFGRRQKGDAEEDRFDAGLQVSQGDESLLLFGAEKDEWRTRKSVAEAVYLYDHCQGRRTIMNGKLLS